MSPRIAFDGRIAKKRLADPMKGSIYREKPPPQYDFSCETRALLLPAHLKKGWASNDGVANVSLPVQVSGK
jgi:hypothetical protein